MPHAEAVAQRGSCNAFIFLASHAQTGRVFNREGKTHPRNRRFPESITVMTIFSGGRTAIKHSTRPSEPHADWGHQSAFELQVRLIFSSRILACDLSPYRARSDFFLLRSALVFHLNQPPGSFFFARLKTQSFPVVPPIEQLRAINCNGHFATLICGHENTRNFRQHPPTVHEHGSVNGNKSRLPQ
jgi:hypothetical protein